MPNRKQILSIVASVLLPLAIVAAAATAATIIGNNVSVGGTMDISATSTQATTSITYLTVSGNAVFSSKLGIGTTTPYTTLDIKGISGTEPLRIASSSGTSLFVLDQQGYVGIGTSTPIYPLEVSGTIRAQNFITSANYPVNDILVPQDVRNYSITSLTGSVGLDMADVELKAGPSLFASTKTDQYLATVPLINGNVLIAYTDVTNSSYGTFVIYDSAGNLVKSATVFESAHTHYISATNLANGNVLIAYADVDNSNYGTFVIYDSSGNLVKSATVFESATSNYISAATLTNGNVFIIYSDAGNSNYGTFVIYDSVGNLVKSPTVLYAGSFYNNENYRALTSLTDGNILIVYQDASAVGTFVIYDSAGNLVKSATTFESAQTYDISSTVMANGSFLIAYDDGGNGDKGTFAVYDSAGSLLKSPSVFETGVTYPISAVTLTNGNVFIAYCDQSNSYYGTFVIYQGTGATFSNDVMITSTNKLGVGTTTPQSAISIDTPLDGALKYLQIDVATSSPATTDCNNNKYAGRMIFHASTTRELVLYACMGSGGWASTTLTK
ncbi:MAG: hypothetical protein PHW31_03570 [Candidatus Pacebacteria bacterium]|nr:hypothetical protein [Candidatus Paceibacterota bacterium]